MKKLMYIATSAMAFAVMGVVQEVTATPFANAESFDSMDVGTTPQTMAAGGMFAVEGEGDGSKVATWTGETPTFVGTNGVAVGMPEPFKGFDINRYLKLDTDTAKVFRKFNSGTEATVGDDGLYMDTLVQFTVTQPEADDPELSSGDKLALWLKAEEDGEGMTTNLYVISRCADDDGNTQSYDFATNRIAVEGLTVEAGQWYRLTVVTGKTVFDMGTPDPAEEVPYFQIYVNGVLAKRVSTSGGDDHPFFSEDWLNAFDTVGFLSADRITALKSGAYIPASEAGTVTLTGMGFQGEGGVDNITMGTETPNFLPGALVAVDFAIARGEHVTAFDYSIDGAASVTASTVASVKMYPGQKIEFSNIAYETGYAAADPALSTTNTAACVTLSGLEATLVAAVEPPMVAFETVEARLSGQGTEADPFIIAKADDLKLFTAGYGTLYPAGSFFKLGAALDLTGSDVSLPLFPEVTDGVPFSGTFDGDNKKITYAIDAPSGNAAFFGFATNAVFKNVQIEGTITVDDTEKNRNCAIFLANAYGTARFENVTTEGSISGNMVKNAAGVCIYADNGPSVAFVACTNRANITTPYTKVGGIFGYTGKAGIALSFEDCYNNGSLTVTGGDAIAGCKIGGICAGSWLADTFSFVNCANGGTLAGTQNICTKSSNWSVDVGGIMGQCTAGSVVFTNCVNAAAITAVSGAGENGAVAADAEIGGVGGILGRLGANSATFKDCSNSGTVTSTVKENPTRCLAGQIAGNNAGQVTLDGENVCAYGSGALPPFGINTASKFTGYAVAWKNHESTTLTWMNLADLLEVEAIGGYVCFTVDGQEFSEAEEASNGKLGVGTCFNIDDAGYDKEKALAYVDTGLIIDEDGYVSKLPFTLNVPESGVTDMQFRENDGEWEVIVSESETIEVLVGDVIEIRGTVNGHTKTISVTASEETATVTLPPAGMCYYLVDQDANDGSADKPYTLGTVADLKNFRDALNDGFGRTLNYKVTADIALTEAWTPVVDFNGTFDGGNYTISNLFFDRAKGNYQGLFAQVTSATNRNLKLVLAGWTGAPKGTTGEDAEFGGAALAGKANTFALFENIVVSGSTTGATHNVAGIVCRTYGGDFTFNNCTNRAEVGGCYSKVGGLVNMVGVSGTTTFNDCANEGHVYVAPTNGVYSGGNNGGVGGFVAYTADAAKVVLSGCSSTGTLENQNSAGQGCGAFVNAPNAGAGSVSAGAKPNVASAAYLPGMIRASYYTGFGAAVVKDGLATWYDDYATAMAALGDATAVKVFVKLANSTVATTTAAAIEFTEIANVADNKVGAGTKVNKDITSDLATYAVAGTAVKDLGAGVYMIATPVTPEITLSSESAEYTAELAFPTVTVAGGYVEDADYTVAWDPATITEPADAATTNTHTVTVTMIGTYTGSATATFKVYKKGAADPEPIVPGEGTMETTITATDADAATNAVVVSSPNATIVSDADYKKYFDLTAEATSTPGQYKVTATLSEEKIELDETIDDVAEKLAEVAAAAESEDVTVVAKPGLYYTLHAGDALNAFKTVKEEQAPASGLITFNTPNKGEKGFYKISVSTTPADK